MKKRNFFRRLFTSRYRLTVLYTGECEVRNIYGTNGRLLRRMARNTENLCEYWMLYKTGPFFLPEREVDSYMKGDRP